MKKLFIIFLISFVGCCAFSNTEKTVNLENNGQIVKVKFDTFLYFSIIAIIKDSDNGHKSCFSDLTIMFPPWKHKTKTVNLKKEKVPP